MSYEDESKFSHPRPDRANNVEHEAGAIAKRVTLVDGDGDKISDANPLPIDVNDLDIRDLDATQDNVSVANASAVVINPSTEEKQDDAIIELTTAVTRLTSILATQTDGTQITKIYDGAFGPAELDNSTNSLQVIDYAHHEIHAGNHFKRGYANNDMDNNDTILLLFVTPNTTKWAHFTLVAKTSDGGATIELFEDTVTSNDGTQITAFNRNRNSSTAATTLTYHTPTVTTNGTKLAEKWIGETDKKADLGGESRGNSEFVLKQNTKYLVKLTANADNMKASIGGDWYEHTDNN